MVSERGESPDRKKVKTETLELNDKIINQLEYYFSDVNVIKDKFMREEFSKNEGWIHIETLMKFAKLKALASNEKDIVDAVSNCKSDVIEIDEQKTKIKRKKELPGDDVQKEIDQRTLHLSGFPLDFTYENLVRWCNQYGETESISMRNFFKVKKFKGCIHVTFKSKADVDEIKKKDLKCKDREIRKEDMDEYRKRKAEMAKKREEKKSARKSGNK